MAKWLICISVLLVASCFVFYESIYKKIYLYMDFMKPENTSLTMLLHNLGLDNQNEIATINRDFNDPSR